MDLTMNAPTLKELQLELQLWQERMNSCQNAAEALKAQGQLLQIQAAEAQKNIGRLQVAVKAATETNDASQETGAEVTGNTSQASATA